jgi:hypothetical protein
VAGEIFVLDYTVMWVNPLFTDFIVDVCSDLNFLHRVDSWSVIDILEEHVASFFRVEFSGTNDCVNTQIGMLK